MDHLTISDIQPLLVAKRAHCPACSHTHTQYCCKCEIPLNHQPPTVILPIPMDIYRHAQELQGKTTSIHAKLVAPEQVSIFLGLESQHYDHPERVLLLFPSESSVPLESIDRKSFDRLIVIDGTWSQAKAMANKMKGCGYRHVRYCLFNEGSIRTILCSGDTKILTVHFWLQLKPFTTFMLRIIIHLRIYRTMGDMTIFYSTLNSITP